MKVKVQARNCDAVAGAAGKSMECVSSKLRLYTDRYMGGGIEISIRSVTTNADLSDTERNAIVYLSVDDIRSLIKFLHENQLV
jgi:hypothetical protein